MSDTDLLSAELDRLMAEFERGHQRQVEILNRLLRLEAERRRQEDRFAMLEAEQNVIRGKLHSVHLAHQREQASGPEAVQ